MTTVTIQPGMAGADYVKLTDEIKTWLLEHDIRFVCRYLVHEWTTKIDKELTAAEVEWCGEHGIAIVPIHEYTHLDGTSGNGRRNALRTVELAEQFEIPKGTHILYALDTDTYHANVVAHTSYGTEFASVVNAAGYKDGMYGDVDAARALQPDLFWRANANGWGLAQPSDIVHVQQHRALYPPGVDPNTCLRPFTAWLPGAADPTPPKETTMLTGFNGQPRIADTRTGLGVRKGLVKSGEVLRLGIPAGADGEPADMAIVTVTVTGAQAPGFVQVDGVRFGLGSNGNYQPGDTEAVPVLAAVDPASGSIGVRLEGGAAHVAVDLMGIVTNAMVIDGELIQRLVKPG